MLHCMNFCGSLEKGFSSIVIGLHACMTCFYLSIWQPTPMEELTLSIITNISINMSIIKYYLFNCMIVCLFIIFSHYFNLILIIFYIIIKYRYFKKYMFKYFIIMYLIKIIIRYLLKLIFMFLCTMYPINYYI